MDSAWSLQHEAIKAALSSAGGTLILGLGWIIGQRLSYRWTIRQKRRESQLSALQQFYSAYGEFFAVWKLWNRLNEPEVQAHRWELWMRAAAAEAMIEGILVKLSSECELNAKQIDDLGRYRQAFQQLREAIRDLRHLAWPSSEDPGYMTFKALSVRVAAMLSGEWPIKLVSGVKAQAQLLMITSNQWENKWILEEFKFTSTAGRN